MTQEHLISNDVSDNQNDEFAIKEFGTDTPNNDLPLGEGCVSACQALPNAPSLDTVCRVPIQNNDDSELLSFALAVVNIGKNQQFSVFAIFDTH